MVIKDNREKSKFTEVFADLRVGQVFLDVDKHICIKTEEDCGICADEDGDWSYSAFALDEKVRPLKTTLVIED